MPKAYFVDFTDLFERAGVSKYRVYTDAVVSPHTVDRFCTGGEAVAQVSQAVLKLCEYFGVDDLSKVVEIVEVDDDGNIIERRRGSAVGADLLIVPSRSSPVEVSL